MTTNPIKYSDLIAPDNSIEKLIQQLTQLQATYTQTAESIKSEALQVVASLKGVSGATEQGRKTTQQAATDADRLAQAQIKLEQAQSKTSEQLASLKEATREANNISKLRAKLLESEEGSYNRLSAQYSLNKIKINQMSEAERQRNKQLIEDTKRIYQQMDAMQRETGKFQLNVGNYQNSILGALGMNNQFGQSLIALGKGGGEGRAAVEALSMSVKGLSASLVSLMANPAFLAILGGTAIVAGAKAWYEYNVGLQEATRLTREFLDVNGTHLIEIRSEIEAIADVYGKEYKEVLQAVDTITKQWGITSEDALKVIRGGFQAGADENGRYLEMIQQYAPIFKDLKSEASEMVAVLAQTRSGIFNEQGLSMMQQALKRLREMSNTTREALQGIGISTDEWTQKLANGEANYLDMLREISRVLAQTNDQTSAYGEVVKEVFGRSGAAGGSELVKYFAEMSTELEDAKKVTGEVGQLQDELIDKQKELNQAVAAVFDLTDDGFEETTIKAKIYLNDVLVKFVKGLQDIVNWFKQAYDQSQAFRGAVLFVGSALGTVWEVAKVVFGYIINSYKVMGEGILGIGEALIGAFSLDWDKVTSGIERVGSAYANFFKGIVRDAKVAGQNIYDLTLANSKDWQSHDYSGSKRENTITTTNNVNKNLNVTTTATTESASGGNTTKDIEKARQEHAKKIEDIEKKQQIDELNIQKETISLRLQAVKKGSEQEYELKKQQIEVERKLALINNKGVSPDDINAAYDAKQTALADSRLKTMLQMFDLQQDLDASEFDLLKNSEQRKTAFRLQQEKARLQKILELNEQASEKMSDAEVQTIQNTIAKIDQELGENAKPRDIYDLFGLNLDDDKKQAITDSFSFATDQLNSYIDSWVQAADAKVELANKEVESAQKALDAEKQARANGYANEVETAQKELDLAKKNQEKALKEQQKAQKAQELVNTIQQASNLVSASALIWAQLGFPWAIPAIAVMWGSFAAAKIKAAQVTKESYGEGTVELLEGGSHQSGNDIDLGTKADGTRRRAEGGEFFAVINKRNSRKFRRVIPDVIRSLNDGTFTTKYMGAYDGASLVFNVQNKDLKGLSEDVREIRERAQHKTYVDASGKTVIQYKNLKRRVG